jgi:hypothetical protein
MTTMRVNPKKSSSQQLQQNYEGRIDRVSGPEFVAVVDGYAAHHNQFVMLGDIHRSITAARSCSACRNDPHCVTAVEYIERMAQRCAKQGGKLDVFLELPLGFDGSSLPSGQLLSRVHKALVQKEQTHVRVHYVDVRHDPAYFLIRFVVEVIQEPVLFKQHIADALAVLRILLLQLKTIDDVKSLYDCFVLNDNFLRAISRSVGLDLSKLPGVQLAHVGLHRNVHAVRKQLLQLPPAMREHVKSFFSYRQRELTRAGTADFASRREQYMRAPTLKNAKYFANMFMMFGSAQMDTYVLSRSLRYMARPDSTAGVLVAGLDHVVELASFAHTTGMGSAMRLYNTRATGRVKCVSLAAEARRPDDA